MKLYDLSQEVFSCRVYPGDPVPRGERLQSMERGDLYNLSQFAMCAHNGTHVDAPAHFLRDGKTIEQMPLEAFVGACYVAWCEGALSADDARAVLQKAADAGCGERILLRGELVVTAPAARVFADAGVMLVGNESQSVGPEDAPMEVHRILLEAGAALLEGVVLRDVPEGRYLLCAAPLSLAGFEGAPCRAVLMEME